MQVKYKNKISAKNLNLLRISVGWQPYQQKQAAAILKNSKVLVAYIDKIPVAMVRWFCDGGAIITLADVIVKPEFQGAGIGKMLLQKAIMQIKEKQPPNYNAIIYLMSAKGKESFYQKCGFTIRPNDNLGAGVTIEL